MKEELEKLCSEFIANRDAIQKAFKGDNHFFFPVCANIFCANGKTADTDRLNECRQIIKKRTIPFSKLRKRRIRPILSGMLSLGDNPEDRMTLAKKYYRFLKRKFKNSEYLVLAAFLLTDLTDSSLIKEKAARGNAIFRKMNRKHRLLTNAADSVFSMLLAFSEKTDDELIEDMEACYRALKISFDSKSDVQEASQVLAVATGIPEGKTQRVIDLYEELLKAGTKYGSTSELAPLAALTLADTPVSILAEEIIETNKYLKRQNGYAPEEVGDQERVLHAVMIVSDQYVDAGHLNPAVMINILDLLIERQKEKKRMLILQVLAPFIQKLFDLLLKK